VSSWTSSLKLIKPPPDMGVTSRVGWLS